MVGTSKILSFTSAETSSLPGAPEKGSDCEKLPKSISSRFELKFVSSALLLFAPEHSQMDLWWVQRR